MSSSTTQTALLRQVRRRGAHGAWRELHDRYAGLIRSVARGWGLSENDCDDVVQEVLVSLVRALPSFRYDSERGSFRGYLKRATVNILQARSRRHRRLISLETLNTTPSLGPEQGLDRLWEREWRRHHLRQALSQLERETSHRDFEVFVRYVIDGHSARTIAKDVGIELALLYQIKSRCMRRISSFIHAQLEREDSHDP